MIKLQNLRNVIKKNVFFQKSTKMSLLVYLQELLVLKSTRTLFAFIALEMIVAT